MYFSDIGTSLQGERINEVKEYDIPNDDQVPIVLSPNAEQRTDLEPIEGGDQNDQEPNEVINQDQEPIE